MRFFSRRMVSTAWFLLILSTCWWWCFARRMLEELIDVLKAKGVPNVVPELLPKGMKWRDVLAFVHKYPRTHLPISNDRVRLKYRKLTRSLFLLCRARPLLQPGLHGHTCH